MAIFSPLLLRKRFSFPIEIGGEMKIEETV